MRRGDRLIAARLAPTVTVKFNTRGAASEPPTDDGVKVDVDRLRKQNIADYIRPLDNLVEQMGAPYVKMGWDANKAKQDAEIAACKTDDELREYLAREVIKRDKEVYELKRIHELSMMRMEAEHRSILRGRYEEHVYKGEQQHKETFENLSTTQHQKLIVVNQIMAMSKLIWTKMWVALAGTILFWLYLYWRYVLDPDMIYSEESVTPKMNVAAEGVRRAKQREELKKRLAELSDDPPHAAAEKTA